eukprot:5926139-Pleurochrysis_carterae.AAC.2
MTEFIEACNKDAFAIRMINIADTTLKNRFLRDYDDDAHGAWIYIEHLHEIKDNDTRISKACDECKALVKEGMAPDTKAAARTMMMENLLELISELEGSAHHWSDNLLFTTLLDTLAAHLPDIVRVYKTGKINQSKWRNDFDQVCLEVFSMLKENSRMEGKNAIDAKRRALRTKTVAAGDDMSSLRNELRQLREQIAAMTTTKSVLRATTSQRQALQQMQRASSRRVLYGEAIATGKLTLEQVAENFTFIIDPARRPAAAAAALKRRLPGSPGAQRRRLPQTQQARAHVRHDQGRELRQRWPAPCHLTRLCAGRRTRDAAHGLQV